MWFYLFHKYLNLDLKDLLMYNHSSDASFLGASSFKERKKIENRKVVELGGKVISLFLYLQAFCLETSSLSQCLCYPQ